MPMQYFLDEYSLKSSAAFTGCSTETEPSASTIAYLVQKVVEEEIPIVLYIELNNGKVAETIASEANKKIGENKVSTMQIQTLHNVTKEDFENGETYVNLMERNLEVLKKALQ
jgi:zinc transport system substrate-binding protein